MTSSRPDIYPAVLPYLGPSGYIKTAEEGAESFAAHVEGSFLSPERNGIQNLGVLLKANSFGVLEACCGVENLNIGLNIKRIAAAPELSNMMFLIPELKSRNIVFSIGQTDLHIRRPGSNRGRRRYGNSHV